MDSFRADFCKFAAVAVIVLGLLGPLGATRAQDLYVANQGSSAIEKFDAGRGSLSNTGATFTTNRLIGPLGLAFDSAGNLYAADYGRGPKYGDAILEYKSVDGVLSDTATQVNGNRFESPVNLAFDKAGDLFATYHGSGDMGNEIIEYPFADGKVSSLATLFAATGDAWPGGLAFDKDGNLFVSFGGKRSFIEKYETKGGMLSPLGTEFASGGLDDPGDMAFDKEGSLYVVSFGNNTIMKFIRSAGSLGTDGIIFNTTDLTDPRGLAFDADGSLYVSSGAGFLVKFTSTDGVLSSSGTRINDTGLQEPGGLAFSKVTAHPADRFLPWAILAALGFSAAAGIYIAKRFGHRS